MLKSGMVRCAQNESCEPWEKINIISLAAAYVPNQQICGFFDDYNSLTMGTVFPQLTGLYIYNFKNERRSQL